MLYFSYIHTMNEIPNSTPPSTAAEPLPGLRALDLNLLRVFDVVMAEGGITRAAERLEMTQPAVSNAMRRLTEALGEPLLARERRGVRATPLGERLWPQVRDALAQLNLALQPALFDPRRDLGVFTLGLVDATAAVLMPPLARALEAAGALAAIRCVPLLTREPRRPLERDEIDMAIGHFPEAAAAVAAEGELSPLRQMRLLDSDYRCVMRREHPLAAAGLTLDNFCAARHVQVSFSGRGHAALDQALAALGRERVLAMTVNQYLTAARVAAASDLLAVLPRGSVSAAGLSEALIERALPLPTGAVVVDAWWHLRNEASPRHRWLREQVRAAAALAQQQVGEADNAAMPAAPPAPVSGPAPVPAQRRRAR
jgi:DNA-binding transcriptional LysR family regulator